MLDNGHVDMHEFLSRLVEASVLEHEVVHSGDTDKGSMDHLSLTMILRTVHDQIIDGESPDFASTFLTIVQTHLKEMLDIVRTHEDDLDLADETCVCLPPDAGSDVKSQDMELDE